MTHAGPATPAHHLKGENMAKKTTPIITHTEIYVRAIRTIEAEIDEWRRRCAGFPQEERDKMFNAATETLMRKLDALLEMYRIETGADYE